MAPLEFFLSVLLLEYYYISVSIYSMIKYIRTLLTHSLATRRSYCVTEFDSRLTRFRCNRGDAVVLVMTRPPQFVLDIGPNLQSPAEVEPA